MGPSERSHDTTATSLSDDLKMQEETRACLTPGSWKGLPMLTVLEVSLSLIGIVTRTVELAMHDAVLVIH